MIPNIFVSSTVADLHHLRDAIRSTLVEVGYIPIMSDWGDIGYGPLTTAEDACYETMKQCQLAVLIIGKRYSGISKDGVSVTQNEYRTARNTRYRSLLSSTRKFLTL